MSTKVLQQVSKQDTTGVALKLQGCIKGKGIWHYKVSPVTVRNYAVQMRVVYLCPGPVMCTKKTTPVFVDKFYRRGANICIKNPVSLRGFL